MNDTTKFFLGANSYMDFVSYFKQLQEQSDSMQLLILKGGPGSGKSSLMKRVLEYAKKKEHDLEIIPCASDPASLDAVIDKTAQFAIMDGTAPHTEDPSLPGVLHHIVYTGDLWDCSLLKKYVGEISALNLRIGDCHKGAGSYIKAAGTLLYENLRYSQRHINKPVINSFIKNITSEFISSEEDGEGKNVRLLSAVSVGEINFFEETVKNLADKIYIINDKWGSAADYILKSILHAAQISSCRVIHCPCSIMPDKTDHIIIPSKRIAFCTQNENLPFSCGERIPVDRLYHTMHDVALMQERLCDAQILLEKACRLVKRAKALHDELEAYYVNAMNFEKMNEIFEDIIHRFYN